jgi:hypothetical protein
MNQLDPIHLADRQDLPRPTPPEGGWRPEGEIPYVDGLPLMAWLGWQMECEGVVEEDAVAGCLMMVAMLAPGREITDETRSLAAFMVETGVHRYVALRASLRQAGEKLSDVSGLEDWKPNWKVGD